MDKIKKQQQALTEGLEGIKTASKQEVSSFISNAKSTWKKFEEEQRKLISSLTNVRSLCKTWRDL